MYAGAVRALDRARPARVVERVVLEHRAGPPVAGQRLLRPPPHPLVQLLPPQPEPPRRRRRGEVVVQLVERVEVLGALRIAVVQFPMGSLGVP